MSGNQGRSSQPYQANLSQAQRYAVNQFSSGEQKFLVTPIANLN